MHDSKGQGLTLCQVSGCHSGATVRRPVRPLGAGRSGPAGADVVEGGAGPAGRDTCSREQGGVKLEQHRVTTGPQAGPEAPQPPESRPFPDSQVHV